MTRAHEQYTSKITIYYGTSERLRHQITLDITGLHLAHLASVIRVQRSLPDCQTHPVSLSTFTCYVCPLPKNYRYCQLRLVYSNITTLVPPEPAVKAPVRAPAQPQPRVHCCVTSRLTKSHVCRSTHNSKSFHADSTTSSHTSISRQGRLRQGALVSCLKLPVSHITCSHLHNCQDSVTNPACQPLSCRLNQI